MKAYELIEWLNEHHPQKFAEEWDNVGLLVGDDQKEISHVFLALDLTEPVLDEAVTAGADMILTHHPMIFSGIKKINNHTFTGRKILRLIREDIPYFAMHTNYDVIGMADLSADYLKLQDTKVLTVTDESGEQPVTGDIDYHTAIDTMADGLAIVDAGHYGTEYIFAEAMEKELNQAFPDLKTTCASVKNPYIVL